MALCDYLTITVACYLCGRYLDIVKREVGEKGYKLVVLPCPCQDKKVV